MQQKMSNLRRLKQNATMKNLFLLYFVKQMQHKTNKLFLQPHCSGFENSAIKILNFKTIVKC